MQIDGSTRIGMVGGTSLVTNLNIFRDLVRTIGFAAIGASVSFFVSLFWKWVIERKKTGRGEQEWRIRINEYSKIIGNRVK